ncbi:molybdopterin-guanine dinucleotide biosynthesis protein B [Limnochorda pilosa]|uniref:Bifunctional molybdopterin-guanine dinucleotide biosynthesis protein MobA/MobB n=1 Tax=Limnochorda pilosa TaxID=1555112 RepID=A0A0K2SIZ6_LIMPI|nr:molybdopterin-guanine dinucleotide biosynthesis protein B [Limnochorda pilosa]BAS27002.1 bifunctional molybdopterin-guanine dinucleotide biosynthesis protein MobA/MobB [Limnochorda pilosa]
MAGPAWGAVVLAAGQARRFGTLKQVLPVRGRPMFLHAVGAALEAGAAQVCVVTGAGREAVEAALSPLRARGLPVEPVFNPEFASGLAGSLRVGLAALAPQCQVAVVLLADQPGVGAGLVAALVRAARSTASGAAAVSYPGGDVGVPAAFGRKLWPRLETLRGDAGARSIVRSLEGVVALEAPPPALADVDTPEAYRALRHAGGAFASVGQAEAGAQVRPGREGSMVPVVCLVGPSGSGKTTLLVRLVEDLVGRGLRVATVKHASHGFQMDRPGKDSHRHFHAGAEAVLISSPEGYALVGRHREEEPPLEALLPLLPPVDLVLVEGFKGSAFPSIEVHRRASGKPRIRDLENRIAVASDEPVEPGLRRFGLDDVQELAEFILATTGLTAADRSQVRPARS